MPRGFRATSATFISTQDGWVLGTAPCAKAPCTSVLRTRDGGKSWVGIPAPRASLDTAADKNGSVNQLRFADARDGFADGAGLWITHNGGASWSRHRTVAGISNAVVTDLAATPAGVYALVSGTDRQYGGTDSHIRLVRADASSGRFHVVTDFGTKTDVGALATSGSAVYLLENRIGTTARTRLIHVQGTSITRTSLPERDCGDITASTPTAVLLECGDGVASGSMGRRHIYGSTDSGMRFTRIPNPGRGAGYDNSGIADAGHGNAVLATVGGETGTLLTTTDGAQKWRSSLTLTPAVFNDLGFENTTHGIVIVNPATSQSSAGSAPGRLYRTVNSGRTWKHIVF